MTDQPPQSADEPKKRETVDPEDIRKALEAHARKRPPRPPVNELRPPIPKPFVKKPPNRSRRKNKP